MKFGPELEAILEDDSSLETRWRYLLRYVQVKKMVQLSIQCLTIITIIIVLLKDPLNNDHYGFVEGPAEPGH